MAKEEELKPWERQDGETAKQFEAFAVYRNMGEDRSLAKVAQELSKSKQLLTRWSSKNNWVERCVAWDREQDRILRQQQLKDIKKMRKRHADLAYAGLVKTAQALQKIDPEDFKPGDIARLMDVCATLERISRGDSGEVIEQRDGGEAIEAVQIYIPDNDRSRENDTFDDLEV